MMKTWMINNKLYFLGALAGAASGFLYWKYMGCLTGSCAITSSPVNSTIYFAIMGSLLFGMFKKKPSPNVDNMSSKDPLIKSR